MFKFDIFITRPCHLQAMKLHKLLLFLAAFVALILFTHKVILPLVYDVVKSDLFLNESKDLGDMYEISTPMTDLAHMNCNQFISDELGPDKQIEFSNKPLHAWNIGDHTYVINSQIDFVDNDGQPKTEKYVCRIQYSQDDGGPENNDNWSVYGLSGISGL